jgi:glucose/arabinose dehydrogenase
MRTPPLLLVAAVCLLALSCSSDDAPKATAVSTIASGETSPAPTPGSGPGASPPAEQGLPASVHLERVLPDVSFARMTGLYEAPDGAWWVTEQAGRVLRIDTQAQTTSVVLDLTGSLNQGNEEGLLGLAFAPDFDTSNAFFVYYSAPNPRRSVIARFVAKADGTTLVGPGSGSVRFEVEEPFPNHNGGQIVFGPDGYLYVGLGDGGSARDPMGNGQNTGTLLGAILRVDVSGADGYEVPSDNPLVGQPGARGEIWAYGLRNPWRFSFDILTGDLWVGDVGQSGREEIDLITKGGNYGWNVMEGTGCLGGGGCKKEGLLLPVIDYENGGGNCSVTGGFVYRGNAVPELRGAYVYSDYCSGKIWVLRYDGSGVTEQAQLADANFNVSSFGQGSDGEVYVLEYASDGGIYRLAP